MFHTIRVRIRSLHWGWQMLLWPLYAVAHSAVSVTGWILGELLSQAKAGTKKVLRPYLWPAVIVLSLFGLYVLIGERGMMLVAGSVFALGLTLFGFNVMVLVPFTKPKKKRR